ncbi:MULTISPECIES: DUF3164 family protein [Pseudoalteromonas]|uniref:DUF3164 family protein n=1 Tax=Pseudoalteromonas TaxID=53246 RepID=UPI001108A154|nr:MULTISPECIES: DUF3164 family protein [Pseudoalteromonas]MCG9760699.1 DUF3164 family protein [Pseudoalteromonas sp. Isolate6]MCG9761470.1 DUF3164 family protein [Pseudoalteromonas sp. Isolate6]NKC21607.1 DUF3164 family protein [Pseudoalteromonas galatheae]NSY33493.1 DUF3164 family protein [Pseudoalteromonas sp. JC28]
MNTQDNTARTFLANPRGYQVPLDKIAAHDIEKHDLVNGFVDEAKALSELHDEFKRKVFKSVNTFIADLFASYNVEIGGNKGNVTLTSYDAKRKVEVGVADQITFGPEINVAKELIDKVINEKLETLGEDKLLRQIVQDAFSTNSDGNYNKARIMALRKYRLASDSEDWANAMQALDDAIILSSTKTYVRFYERNALGSWVHIPLVSKSL